MTDHLPPYPAYKDSGVPWLGEVPEHWDVCRLKSRLVRNDSGVWSNQTDDFGTIVLRSTEQTITGGWRIENPARLILTENQRSAALLVEGDLVITKSSGSPSHIGKTSLVTKEVAALQCYFSNFMQRLRLRADTRPELVWHFLNSRVGRKQLVFQSTTTTGLGNLNGSILGQSSIVVPPLPEQLAIVHFLDYIDRRIRRYIRAKQKLIKLLNEQKEAIIHQAVTGQIDVRTGRPYPVYKRSGVEWLGEVPEHWDVLRLGRLIILTTGFPFRSEGFSQFPDDIRLLRGINVVPGRIRWEAVVRWAIDDIGSFTDFEMEAGDIVLGMDRPCVTGGVRVAVISDDDVPSLLLQRVARIRTQQSLNAQFAFLLLSGRSFSDYLSPIFTGISVPHVSPEQIEAFRLALPNMEEQALIVAWVAVTNSATDSAIDRAEREIQLLREYRTRLIADVVTGKVDVREAARLLPDGGDVQEVEPVEDWSAAVEEEGEDPGEVELEDE